MWEREVYDLGVMSLPDVIATAMPAVVNIDVVQPAGFGNGSGFAIQPAAADDGSCIVVTNAHVVAEASSLTIRFYDDRAYPAALQISDPSTDLALLKVNVAPVAVLDARPLADIRVGEPAIAIGSPYGMAGTVTGGIISGLDRTMPGFGGVPIDNMIQTDALINPGNSGGPLIGADGRVIGVNAEVRVSDLGDSSGLGFAIPIETAHMVYREFCETGEGQIKRATIGTRIQLRQFTPDERERWQQKAGALLLDTPQADAPAGIAQLKRGDVIVGFDGMTIDTPGDLYRVLDRSRIGKDCTVRYVRDGDLLESTVVPVVRPVT